MALTASPLQLLNRLLHLKRLVFMLLFVSALPLAILAQFFPMSQAIDEPVGRAMFWFVTVLGGTLTALLWRWPGTVQLPFFNALFVVCGNVMVVGGVIGEMLLFRSNTTITLMLWPMVATAAFQNRALLLVQILLGSSCLFLLAYLKQVYLNPGWWWGMDGMVMVMGVTVTGVAIAYFRETAVHEATELARVVNLDPLTGLSNRRQLDTQFSEVLDRVLPDEQVAVVVLDLDHFKTINDRFGHQAGDEVIIAFAGALKEHASPTDLVARLGGEEFMWITTTPHPDDVVQRVNALRAQYSVSTGARNVTVSAGVVCWPGSTTPALSRLMHDADQALYCAKEQGRNRVCLADVPGTEQVVS